MSASSAECKPGGAESDSQDPENDSLDLTAMSGICVVHGICLVVAFVIFFESSIAEKGRKWMKKRRKKEIDEQGIHGERCPGNCGMQKTDRHSTHCCATCASIPGLHGPKCAMKPCIFRSQKTERRFSESGRLEDRENLFCSTSTVPAALQHVLMNMVQRLAAMEERFDNLENNEMRAAPGTSRSGHSTPSSGGAEQQVSQECRLEAVVLAADQKCEEQSRMPFWGGDADADCATGVNGFEALDAVQQRQPVREEATSI